MYCLSPRSRCGFRGLYFKRVSPVVFGAQYAVNLQCFRYTTPFPSTFSCRCRENRYTQNRNHRMSTTRKGQKQSCREYSPQLSYFAAAAAAASLDSQIYFNKTFHGVFK